MKVDPNSSHDKDKFFSIYLMLYLHEMVGVQ